MVDEYKTDKYRCYECGKRYTFNVVEIHCSGLPIYDLVEVDK